MSISAETKSPAGKLAPSRASFLLGNFDGHVFDRKFRKFFLQRLVRTPCGFFQHFSLLRCDLAVGDELVDLLFDKDSAAGGVGDIQNGPDRFVDFGDLFLGEVRASAHDRHAETKGDCECEDCSDFLFFRHDEVSFQSV